MSGVETSLDNWYRREGMEDLAKSLAARGIYGGGLECRDMEKAAAALEMLGAGVGPKEICEELDISYGELSGLKGRHLEWLGKRKEVAAFDAMESAERIRWAINERVKLLLDDDELLAKTNFKELGMAYDFLNEHAGRLRGEANVVVEHRKGVSLDDAVAAIEAARKKVKDEAIEVDSEDA